MNSVQIEQKSYEMPPREGISIAQFLTVADIERSAHYYEKVCAESIRLRSRVEMGVWNAWHHRKVGGFISAGVPSVGTSDAVTVRRTSMHPSTRRQRGIRSLPVLSRVRIGFTITRRKG